MVWAGSFVGDVSTPQKGGSISKRVELGQMGLWVLVGWQNRHSIARIKPSLSYSVAVRN